MGPSLSFFVCPSRLDVRIRIELGGNGHKPPGQKSPQAKDPPDKSTPGQKSPGPGHPTSGDVFYCSGSRQLNHSSSFIPLFLHSFTGYLVVVCFIRLLSLVLLYVHLFVCSVFRSFVSLFLHSLIHLFIYFFSPKVLSSRGLKN